MVVLRDVEEHEHFEALQSAARENMEALWRDVNKPPRQERIIAVFLIQPDLRRCGGGEREEGKGVAAAKALFRIVRSMSRDRRVTVSASVVFCRFVLLGASKLFICTRSPCSTFCRSLALTR